MRPWPQLRDADDADLDRRPHQPDQGRQPGAGRAILPPPGHGGQAGRIAGPAQRRPVHPRAGPGYDDEEITALGGPALSPAEKVDGLAEAIQVIQGGWTRPGFTQHGHHHSVRNLELEPRPAQPIPVWLGTFGPALAVTGRLADGWIPSLGYRPTEEFPAMRRRIDAAAEAAGRRPEDIRGLLNLAVRIDPAAGPQPDLVTGSVRQVVSQLQDLLSLGFTGFNFMVRTPADLPRLAEEVLPELAR